MSANAECPHDWMDYREDDLRSQYLEQLKQKQIYFYNYAVKVLQVHLDNEPDIAQYKTILERKLLDLVVQKQDMLCVITPICFMCGQIVGGALLSTHRLRTQ